MKITINTEILRKHNLSLGEFLLMLLSYFDLNHKECYESLINKCIADRNLFHHMDLVLSDNTRNLVAEILTQSNERVIKCGIDFEKLAADLQELYPEGCRDGTSYSWRGSTREIAQKLRLIVANYNFLFTPQEAIDAVKEYVSNFEPPYKGMKLLKYFILKTKQYDDGQTDRSSLFMTIIENNRENNEDNN